jgi:hypothetical protein
VGVAELVLVGALASMLNILIRLWLIVIPLIVLLVFLVRIPIEPSKIRYKVTPTEVMLMLFTVIALASRVVSIKGFSAPVNHDPISHATWASDIVETGLIKTFYSPGLHIVCAFGNMVDSVFTATYVLRLTNILNALLIIPVFYFLDVWFNKKYLSILGAFIFLVSLYPARFFWVAGKNALVMNLPFFFLVLFFYKSLENFSVRRIVLVNLLVFVSIINHYPSAVIILIALLAFILSNGQLKQINTMVIGILLGLFWGVSKLSYFTAEINSSVSVYNDSPIVTIQNVLDFFINFINQTRSQFDFSWGDYVLMLSLVLILVIALLSTKRKDYRPFTYFVMFYVLIGLIIYFFQPARNYLRIVYETQVITFFLIVNTSLSIILGEILNALMTKKPTKSLTFIVLAAFALCSIYSGRVVYKEFRGHQSTYNMVSLNDISMFEWIDKNVDSDKIILNNAHLGFTTIVFTNDGASWIPAFTDNEIAMPFVDFDSIETHENYEIYTRLFNHNYTCQDLDLLISKNITYYYLDSHGVFSPLFEPGENNQNFLLIKEIDGVELYEIIPCPRR